MSAIDLRVCRARLETANERIAKLEAQDAADYSALADAMHWAREFRPDMPTPSRAVTEIVDRLRRAHDRVDALTVALRSVATLVVDPHAAASFTYSNLCEAVSVARNALEDK